MADRPSNNTNLYDQAVAPRRFVVILESAEKKQAPSFDNGEDLSKNNREFYAKYVSDRTVAAGNNPALVPEYTKVSGRNKDGTPANLFDPEANGQRTYISMYVSPDAANEFDRTSNPGSLDVDGDKFKIRRGKLNSSDPSAAEIFKDIDSKKEKSDFSQRVQKVLLRDGGYNTNNPYWPNKSNNENDLIITSLSYQKLGEFGGRKWPTVSTGKNIDLTIEDLKKTAILLALNSTGETLTDVGSQLTQKLVGDVDSSAMEAIGSVVSRGIGLARIGQKIPVSRFDAVKAVQTVKPGLEKYKSTSFIENDSKLSYGNVNSMFVPFTGGDPTANILTARLMFTTLLGLLKATATVLPKSENTARTFGTIEDRAKNIGSSIGKAGQENLFQEFFGFPNVTYDLNDCLEEGTNVFFGQSDKSAGRLEKESFYYNVILRNLFRSTSQFFANPFTTGNGSAGSILSNVVSQFNPFSLKDNIRELPIVKFIGVLLSIGNNSLKLKFVNGSSVNAGIFEVISIIDGITETDKTDPLLSEHNSVDPAVLRSKNRLESRNGMLSMGTSTLKSMFIFPDGIINASNLLEKPGVTEGKNLLGTSNKLATETNGDIEHGRIKPELVKQMEDYLERDYMPFYFHDLRTNEICSFHAFIEDIQDNLSADYNESEFYGRVGTVPIYKNTKRAMNLTFRVIAVNEEDHEQMWFKINKLAMLLFPQWSEGRRIEYRGNRLIQPFSQVPAAAPLIRLRVGDFWKSNYSKFALARLFGVTGDTEGDNATFKLSSMQTNIPTSNDPQVNLRVNQIVARNRSGDYQVGDFFRITNPNVRANRVNDFQNNPLPTARGRGRGRNALNTVESTTNVVATDYLNPGATAVFRVTEVLPGRVKFQIIEGSGFVTSTARPPQTNPRRRGQAAPTPSETAYGKTFVISVGNHMTTAIANVVAREEGNRQNNRTNNAVSGSNVSQNASRNTDILTKFFSKDDNPIVKSFESTKGRGVAGFIKSMNTDFSEARWATDKFGARAPMSLKITMEFLPIFDIQPGLDSRGFMTAPVWSVGNIVRGVSGMNDEEDHTDSLASFVKGTQKLPNI
jgi:hypothetical protein